MSRKAISLISALLAAGITCSGCWDAVDINKRNIIVTAINDKKGGEFVFYSEIANVSEDSVSPGKTATQQDMFSILKGTGATYTQARAALESRADKMYFMGTLRTIIFTRDFANDDIREYMYRARQDVMYRKTLLVVITSADPEDVLSVQTENEVSAGKAVEDTIDHLADSNNALAVTASDVLEKLASANVCFLVPDIAVVDKDIIFDGYSIIFNDVFKGFIPYEQSQGVLYMLVSGATWIYTVPYGDNTATVKVTLKSKKIKPRYEDGKISFSMDFNFDSLLMYLNTDENLDDGSLEEIKTNLQQMLLNDIGKTIYTAQTGFGCDYLNFSEDFRINYPAEYRDMDWSKEFLNATFTIGVRTTLDPGGLMNYKTSSGETAGDGNG